MPGSQCSNVSTTLSFGLEAIIPIYISDSYSGKVTDVIVLRRLLIPAPNSRPSVNTDHMVSPQGFAVANRIPFSSKQPHIPYTSSGCSGSGSLGNLGKFTHDDAQNSLHSATFQRIREQVW